MQASRFEVWGLWGLGLVEVSALGQGTRACDLGLGGYGSCRANHAFLHGHLFAAGFLVQSFPQEVHSSVTSGFEFRV